MDIKRVLEIIAKSKWIILFSMALTLLLVWGVTRLLPAKWQATVRYAITTVSPILEGQNQSQDNEEREKGARTEVFGALVKDEDVVSKAAATAGITVPLPELVKAIEFEAKGSRLFEMRYSDRDPLRAKKFANALADNFIQKNQSIYTDQAHKNSELLNDQIKESDRILLKLRTKFQGDSEKYKTSGDPNSEIVIAQRALESAKYAKSEAKDRVVANRSLLQNQSTGGLPNTITQAVPGGSSLLQDTIQIEINKLDEDLRQARSKYQDVNPVVKELVERRKLLQSKLDEARNSQILRTIPNPVVANRPQTIMELKAQIDKDEAIARAQDASITKAEAELARLRSTSSPMSVLKGQIDAEAEHRAGLAARYNLAQTALDIAKRNNPLAIVAKVGDSNPPMNTTNGRNQKILILAILAAFLLTTSLAVIFDSMDKRLKTMKEAEIALPAKVLAVIPPPQGEALLKDWARAAELQPQSPQAEAYRFLGQHLLTPQNRYFRSMMVLAAKSGQGNTRTVTNLAITLAQSGHSVILIDANVRQPALHKVFGVSNQFGLTNVLQDPNEATIKQALLSTDVANLRLITSGPEYGNPWELFGSSRLHKMAEILQAEADYLLYDTSNASLYSDTLSLATIVDGALLCVRAVEPLTGAEQRLKDVLEQSEIPILGTILVDAPPSLLGSYQSYAPPVSNFVQEAPVGAIEASSEQQKARKVESLFEEPDNLPVPVSVPAPAPVSFPAPIEKESFEPAIAMPEPMFDTQITERIQTVVSKETGDVTLASAENLDTPAPVHAIEETKAEPAKDIKKELEMANGFETPPGGFPRAISGYAVGPVDDYVRKMNARLETLLQQLDQENGRHDDFQKMADQSASELELTRHTLLELEKREMTQAEAIKTYKEETGRLEQELNEERARTKSGYDKLLAEARQEAERMLAEERQDTEILITNAQRNAASLVAEARRNAEESHARAEELQAEIERLKSEMAAYKSRPAQAVATGDASPEAGDYQARFAEELAAHRSYMMAQTDKMLEETRARVEEASVRSSSLYRDQENKIASLSRDCEALVAKMRMMVDGQAPAVSLPVAAAEERRTHESRDWRSGDWKVGSDWRNAS